MSEKKEHSCFALVHTVWHDPRSELNHTSVFLDTLTLYSRCQTKDESQGDRLLMLRVDKKKQKEVQVANELVRTIADRCYTNKPSVYG